MVGKAKFLLSIAVSFGAAAICGCGHGGGDGTANLASNPPTVPGGQASKSLPLSTPAARPGPPATIAPTAKPAPTAQPTPTARPVALSPTQAPVQTVTLAEAVRHHLVESTVSGDDLQSVSVSIKRRSRHPLIVNIPAGTYFVSGGSAQNMVACADASADLTDTDSAQLSVGAACANFYQDQPDSDNKFSVREAHPDARLRKLLSVISSESPSSIASQLAIWSITDNPSRSEVDGHISPSPDDDDFKAAAKLLKAAGLSPGSRKMFRDDS